MIDYQTNKTSDEAQSKPDISAQTTNSQQQNFASPSGIIMEKYNNGFKPQSSQSEMDKKAKSYLLYMLFATLVYFAGFIYFALNLEYTSEFPNTHTDAIITLTGETKRITDSITELAKGNAPRLFISGVHKQTPLDKIINKTLSQLQKNGRLHISAENIKAHIETGRAENTIENAIESATWVNKNKISSIRVVTSFYHMPRVKLLFAKYLPKTPTIFHPITFHGIDNNPLKDPKLIIILLGEYNKYILTYLWNLTGLETKTALTIQGVISK